MALANRCGLHGLARQHVTKALAGADSVFWLVLPDPHAESVEAAYVGFNPVGVRRIQEPGGQAGGRSLGPGPRGSLRVADLRGGPPEDLLKQAEGVFKEQAGLHT
jgi:hypothetical protein